MLIRLKIRVQISAEASAYDVRKCGAGIRCTLRHGVDFALQVSEIIVENQIDLLESSDLRVCGCLLSLQHAEAYLQLADVSAEVIR